MCPKAMRMGADCRAVCAPTEIQGVLAVAQVDRIYYRVQPVVGAAGVEEGTGLVPLPLEP